MKFQSLSRSLVLAFATLAIVGCDSTGSPDVPAPVTHVKFFTGGLYVLGGDTTQLSFTASQKSNTDKYVDGTWTIKSPSGKLSNGDFVVKKKGDDHFTLQGSTDDFTKITFGLENINGDVFGSSSSSVDALVWDLKTVKEGENTVVAGSIFSSNEKRGMKNVDVSITILPNGEIDGKLTYLGETTKLTGFYDPKSAVKIPLAAIAELMVISVFHTAKTGN